MKPLNFDLTPAEGGPWSDLHERAYQNLYQRLRRRDPATAESLDADTAPYRRREVVRAAARVINIQGEDL
jgi:hypothetical protein